jgi:hypothetical protein
MVLISGCGPDSPTDFVVVVGDKKITIDEFQKKMNSRNERSPDTKKKVLLDEIISFEILYASAVNAGYDKNQN